MVAEGLNFQDAAGARLRRRGELLQVGVIDPVKVMVTGPVLQDAPSIAAPILATGGNIAAPPPRGGGF